MEIGRAFGRIADFSSMPCDGNGEKDTSRMAWHDCILAHAEAG